MKPQNEVQSNREIAVSKIDKFEYTLIANLNENIAILLYKLNKLGEEGWELVYKDNAYAIFKRKLQC